MARMPNAQALSTALAATLWISAGGNAQSDVERPARPNLVVVFIDDMGYADLSCFGNEESETPEIDRLAAEGIVFEQFYVNSPICSPSRVALTTGQYPTRHRITSYLAHRQENERRGLAQWLDPEIPTLARTLQAAGYRTINVGRRRASNAASAWSAS